MAVSLGTYVAGTVFGLEVGSALFLLTAGATVVATAYGLSRVINGNQNKGPNAAAGSQGGRIQVPPATNNKIPVVYGNAFVNGIITDARLKSLGGENNDTMYYCIVLSEVCNDASAVYDIDDIYWNDLRLVPVDSTINSHKIKEGRKNVDNPDGVTEDFVDTNFVVDDKSFVEVRVYAGGSTAADQIWPAQSTGNTANAYTFWADNDGSWTSAYEMKGLVFAIVKLTYGGEKGFTGLANMTFRVDNTVNNPADVWYDYMTSQRYGAGVETSAIDTTPSTSAWAQWKAYCNDLITYTPVGGGSTTQKRYTINGVVDTAQQVKPNIDSILQNGGAWMSYNVATGLWLPIPKRAATSGELAAALQFSDDNIISGITMGSTRLEDLYNKFEVEFYNKYNKDQRAYARLDLPAALRNANEPDNQLRMSLDFVNNSVQAELIGQLELRQSRDDIVVEFDTNHYGIQAQAGDVIAVTNSLYGWAPKYFRVMRVKEIEGEDGSLTASIQAVEYNADAYSVEPITEFTTIANIGIGNLVSSVGLPSPNNPTITDVNANASVPNFTFNVVIPSTGGPFDEIEVYFTEGWDSQSVTMSVAAGTGVGGGGNGVPVGKGLMTVTAVTYNSLNVGDYFLAPDVVIESQLTQTTISTKTYSSGGAVGTYSFTLNNVTDVVIGQKPTGTGIPTGAMVVGISGSQVILDKAFTVQATGSYLFTTVGGTGTYQVDNPAVLASAARTLYDQPIDADFRYLKKITPPGNASNFETGATISTVITELPANSQTFRRYFLKARLGVKKNFGAFTNNTPVDLDGNNVSWQPSPLVGGSLNNLTDVLISSASEGQTLYYDADLSKWRNNSNLKVNDTTGNVEISGDLLVGGTNISTGVTNTIIEIDRTTTGTTGSARALILQTTSTGTPTVGFGTALEFSAQTDATNFERAAYIDVRSTDITAGSEDFAMNFALMAGGTTYTDKLSLLSDGNLIVLPGYNNTTTPIGIQGPIAASDFWFVGGNDPSGTGSNNGAMIIASGNNGNEPIYVRQYTGGSTTLPFPGTNTIQREATLLDASGNTVLPGDLAVNGGDITTTQTTASLFNTTATTLNVGGAATTTNIGLTLTSDGDFPGGGSIRINNTATPDEITLLGELQFTRAQTASGAPYYDGAFPTLKLLDTTEGESLNLFPTSPLIYFGARASEVRIGSLDDSGYTYIAGDRLEVAGPTGLKVTSSTIYGSPTIQANIFDTTTGNIVIGAVGGSTQTTTLNATKTITNTLVTQSIASVADGTAISLTTAMSFFTTATVGGETSTLANGATGQFKSLMLKSRSNSSDMVVTVSTAGWKSGSSGTITFDAVGDSCLLQYGSGGWFAVGANGVTFA